MRAGNAGGRFYCLIVDRILPVAQVVRNALCEQRVLLQRNRDIDSTSDIAKSRKLLPFTSTLPESGSYKRIASDINVISDACAPTMAVMLPFRAVRLTSESTGFSGLYPKVTDEKRISSTESGNGADPADL
ncbi:MAG: hypothetical protein CM15mP84_01650 [Cellvibrionales bacterium]|nr:MAG: hypothetical protein CM15mP84_01650 [Cellvibrionales bacterium]